MFRRRGVKAFRDEYGGNVRILVLLVRLYAGQPVGKGEIYAVVNKLLVKALRREHVHMLVCLVAPDLDIFRQPVFLVAGGVVRAENERQIREALVLVDVIIGAV